MNGDDGIGNEGIVIVYHNPLPTLCDQASQNYHRNFHTNEMRTLLNYCPNTSNQHHHQQEDKTKKENKWKYVSQ